MLNPKRLITALVLLGACQMTIAAQEAAFGSVLRLKGDVSATDPDGKTRQLREGDTVFAREHVRAAGNAEAIIKTQDAGFVAARPGSEFVAEKYVVEGKKSDTLILRLVNGSLRIISGWISKTNPSGYKVETPHATIGIRGTDHEPYVLSPELAASSGYRVGTYDKVNQGGTTLANDGNSVDIDPGKVGFVRANTKGRTRALMTLLLPTLLDHIPNFYVPGEFDDELDRHSRQSNSTSTPPANTKDKAVAQAARPEKAADGSGNCAIGEIAETWLSRLDRAIEKGDGKAILAMYAPSVSAKATVRTADGESASIEFERDELVTSTLNAARDIKNYKHRRISIDARHAAGSSDSNCRKIEIKSVVIEQGSLSGKPYRFESSEEITIELFENSWQAVRLETTQR